MAPPGSHCQSNPAAPAEGDAGTVTGIVAAKGAKWIDVKAERESEPRRYIPVWHDGGLDKDMLRRMAGIRAGDTVCIGRVYNERKRVVELAVVAREGE